MFYSDYSREQKELFQKITDNRILSYVSSNLSSSLNSIGFSKRFINFLTNNIHSLNFAKLYNNFELELKRTYDKGFFQKIVPSYFQDEVISYIPSCERLLDIGCGTGILIHILNSNKRFKHLTGIDIHTYPEWKRFKSPKSDFRVLQEKDFIDFLKAYQPDCITMTWTLHHMEFNEQKRYLRQIKSNIKKGTKIIILEDSYSTELMPNKGQAIYDTFMDWKINQRKEIMSIYDWLANRILARRSKVPIPFTYRTLEQWEQLCKELGFKTLQKVFVGFPEKRDINTPQSLLVVQK